FIGVSIWENDQADVKPFVEKMGDKMAYVVAMDSVPENAKANAGAMAESWMKAAGRNGIPSAFIVSGGGKIYWMGHPMQMDEPLEKIVSGSWDLNTAKEEHRKAVAKQEKLLKLTAAVSAAVKSGQPNEIVSAVNAIVELRPELEPHYGPMKVTAYIKLG